jgi:hypothetical protein
MANYTRNEPRTTTHTSMFRTAGHMFREHGDNSGITYQVGQIVVIDKQRIKITGLPETTWVDKAGTSVYPAEVVEGD